MIPGRPASFVVCFSLSFNRASRVTFVLFCFVWGFCAPSVSIQHWLVVVPRFLFVWERGDRSDGETHKIEKKMDSGRFHASVAPVLKHD